MPVRLVQCYYTATAPKPVIVIANVAKQALSVPRYVNVREGASIMTIPECSQTFVNIKGKTEKSEIDHIAF